MGNLDKVWVVGKQILPPENQIPSIDGMVLMVSPDLRDFESRVESEERISLIAEDKYAESIQSKYKDRIDTMRVGVPTPSPQLFEEQLISMRSELRMIHDFSIAEEIAWSGGIATEAKVIRKITEAMVRIFACNDNALVQKCLQEIVSDIVETSSVKLFVDPPYAPLAELKLQDLAIPIQFEGKLYAHLYVKLQESVRNKEFRIDELSEFLLGLSDVIALTLERNRALQDATRSRALWQASFDAIEDPVLIIDSDLVVLQANRSYLELVNKDIENVLNKECPLFEVSEISAYMKFPRSEWELSFSNRSYRVFLDRLLEQSEDSHFVIRLQDFTREKQLRETMMAKEQRSNLGVLISSVAHDINNPIGGILAFCQILEKDFEKDSVIGRDIQTIKEEAGRCQNVIQTMLTLVRKSQNEPEIYSVSDCISSVMNLLRPALKRSKFDIEWQDETLIRYDLPKIWGYKEKTLQAIFQSLQELVAKLGESKVSLPRRKRRISVSTEINQSLILRFHCPLVPDTTDLDQSVSYYLSSILLEEQGGSIQINQQQDHVVYEFRFAITN